MPYVKIDFVDKALPELGSDSPLDLYCSYTMDQILVALGKHTEKKRSSFREGVLYLSEKKLDVFFVTLNKSEKDYSPSTMYQDYSINEELFHWQSQSRTTEESVTGQRYLNQAVNGGNVYLSWVGRLSKSLWFVTDQYCLEDEGAAAGVCDEEDGEGLTHSCSQYIKKQGASRQCTWSTLLDCVGYPLLGFDFDITHKCSGMDAKKGWIVTGL